MLHQASLIAYNLELSCILLLWLVCFTVIPAYKPGFIKLLTNCLLVFLNHS